MLNFVTARVRVSRTCEKPTPRHDLDPLFWEQLPAHILLDPPFSLTGLVSHSKVIMHKNVVLEHQHSELAVWEMWSV
eukprot:1894571-Rhodomonas_salina.5